MIIAGRGAWVQIALDLTPARLTLAVPERVTPPDEFAVSAIASEALSAAGATFVDALGVLYPLGVTVLDTHTVALSVPSVGMATGPGTLTVWVLDLAGNRTEATDILTVARPRPYDLLASTGGAFDLDLAALGSFGLGTDTGPAHDLASAHLGALDLVSAQEPLFTITTESDYVE